MFLLFIKIIIFSLKPLEVLYNHGLMGLIKVCVS